ncbi:MAG: hypothetical protein ABJL57_03260, partial [Hyphomonas sp.]|uniref:hypothetical protein n=1 Tax=Hyphomonas sp. TaxID=87 RepID=UPI003299B9E4
IDGSNISHRVRNGFPGAEASIVMMSVVFIDITKLAAIGPDEIPSPKLFNEMDSAHTLDEVLPGANIVRADLADDTPTAFFRSKVFDALSGRLDPAHETLLETLRAISDKKADIICPIEDCQNAFHLSEGCYDCKCDQKATLFETDSFRFHERFNELGSNGEVHGEVRHVLEVLSLVNILRFFSHQDRLHYLRDCAFVLDGPLAVFGQPAAIAPYVRREIMRISDICRREFGKDLLIIGVEKSGQYVSHFEQLDWSDEISGEKFAPRTVLIPDARYVNRNIVFRPEDAKPSGADTYFGRKVLYKTRSGSRAVLNIAMVNEKSADFTETSSGAFPRLPDALNVLDHLSTYLYRDGFMPLVRAHAHAAIPLKRGTDIIAGLFE